MAKAVFKVSRNRQIGGGYQRLGMGERLIKAHMAHVGAAKREGMAC